MRLPAAGVEHYRDHGLRSVATSAAAMGANRALTRPRLDALGLRVTLRRLRRRQRDEHGLSGVLDTAFEFRGVGRYQSIAPAQVRSELAALAERLEERDPATVLEIGSARGGTLYVWARALAAGRIVSLDLPGGGFGGGYSARHERLFDGFDPATDVRCVRDNSHALSTRDDVRGALDGRGVDFLFIDGDHTYGGVKADFELYAPLVRDGGLVALHDIVAHPDTPNCEVDAFWRELREEYETEEIVADPNQEWAGIGLVRV